jgi:cytoskeleton protein RodZ
MAFVCEAMAHSELGDQLHRTRENKSLSLDDAEKMTGIRKRFLQAMEEGRFDALPGTVQVRGFLKSYAGCLGLSAEEIVASYEHETRSAQTAAALKSASPARPVAVRPAPPRPKLQPAKSAATLPAQPAAPPPPVASPPQPAHPSQPAVTPPAQTQPAPKPPAAKLMAALPMRSLRLPAWLTAEIGLIALAVVLVLCVAALAAFIFLGPRLSQPALAPHPTATRTARATAPLPTIPPATPTVMPLSQITTSIRTTSTTSYVQVALAATEHVWVRVSTDGTTAFEGMFAPGQALNWEAKELLIVEASNGAGLTASYNGKPVGVLGSRGQVVARAWTPTGETTLPPTPTVPAPLPSPTP